MYKELGARTGTWVVQVTHLVGAPLHVLPLLFLLLRLDPATILWPGVVLQNLVVPKLSLRPEIGGDEKRKEEKEIFEYYR